MVYIRSKKIGKRTYYYIVDHVMENGKRRQKVIAYLGTAENVLKKINPVKDRFK
jgi:hypothetical protein